MRPFIKALVAAFLLLASSADTVVAVIVQSPDRKLVLHLEVTDFDGARDCAVYQVSWEGRAVIANSRLGLEIDPSPLQSGFQIIRHEMSSHDSTWNPVYGERSTIRDRYNQLVVELREKHPPHRLLTLTFRAYDEGVAFCYTIPKQAAISNAIVRKEQTEFRFPADYMAWAAYTAQGQYAKVPLSAIKPGCERPLTIEAENETCIAIAEARLVDYARMKFAPLKGAPHALVSDLSSAVTNALPLTTPWRVVMVAKSPGRLLENNDLILNLNDPCAIADTSWIKPGKVIREVTLTTAGGKACVDFAVKRGLQYIEFDAGWYGHEYDDNADARVVNVDPKRSKGPLDLQEVIRYAKERGVGVWLYVNRRALEKQLDEILPLYRKWGVKGVKYGFVNVGSQQWTAWLHEAIRKAAENQLMVDVHDEYRPTGFARTYPNLLTQEGIAGDETSPANNLSLAILFSRMLAGPADNTICYYDKRVDANASHAYQLAKAVCLYSPLQFLYWYDRPKSSPLKVGGAGNAETSIGDEPELEFWDAMPTVWDDTKVLRGRIGEYAVIARRRGSEWFIGAMNDQTGRTLEVPLGFLEAGRKYTAHIYADAPDAPTRTKVQVSRREVQRDSVLNVKLPPRGGQAVRIVPSTLKAGELVEYGPLAFKPEVWKSKGQSTRLLPWTGSNVVFLTTNADFDPNLMARWVAALDQGWQLYADLTGQRPSLFKHINGRATIAAVPDFDYTCGAGCGYVGSTGIELAMLYRWNYPALLRNSNAIPHYAFYEMGRNFYTFGSRHSCFTTGFAVFMRNVCMDTLKFQDDDRGVRQTIEAAESMIRRNEMPFLRMFTNVDGLTEKQPRLKDEAGKDINPSDQPVMYASAMSRLWRENGRNEWLQRFYRALRDCPSVSGRTREGAQQQCWNWYAAASVAARRDLSGTFADEWRLPLSPEARKALQMLNWREEGLTPEKVTAAVKAVSSSALLEK